MVTITLKPTDNLQTLLPTVETAMESGDICRIGNIQYLGPFELAALITLTTATHLWDTDTRKVYNAHPNFRLFGIDHQGVSRCLVN